MVIGGIGAGWTTLKGPAATVTQSGAGNPDPAVVCTGYVDLDGGIIPLMPTQPGRVVSVETGEGQTVKAGQVLLRLDDRAARARLDEAAAGLRAAERELDQARQLPGQHAAKRDQQLDAIDAIGHRLAAAREQLERQKELSQKKLIGPRELAVAEESVKELEAAARAEQSKLRELDLLDPKPAVDRAEAQVASLHGRVAQAQLALDECSVKAPRDGSVLRLQAAVGDMVGVPGAVPPVQFCADEPLIIRAEVAQEFAAAVKNGASCRILDDAGAVGTSWDGKVLSVSNWYTQRRSVVMDPTQFNDVRTLECKIQVRGNAAGLRIGQRVRVLLDR
jgi:multidrug resistance efflux pump